MKRLSLILMILFLSACGDGETESNEIGNKEDETETEKVEKETGEDTDLTNNQEADNESAIL